MVKLECLYAFVVAATATLAAFVLHGHRPNLLPTPPNRVDNVGSAICVAPLLHHFSPPRSQSAALPAELPGNNRWTALGLKCFSEIEKGTTIIPGFHQKCQALLPIGEMPDIFRCPHHPTPLEGDGAGGFCYNTGFRDDALVVPHFLMRIIEIPDNPNCDPVELRVFNDLEPPHPVVQVRFERQPEAAAWYEVTGWTTSGAPCPAFVQKVDDSGEGVIWLVFGGDAGLRLRPAGRREPWGLAHAGQWGEPFLLIVDPADVQCARQPDPSTPLGTSPQKVEQEGPRTLPVGLHGHEAEDNIQRPKVTRWGA